MNTKNKLVEMSFEDVIEKSRNKNLAGKLDLLGKMLYGMNETDIETSRILFAEVSKRLNEKYK